MIPDFPNWRPKSLILAGIIFLAFACLLPMKDRYVELHSGHPRTVITKQEQPWIYWGTDFVMAALGLGLCAVGIRSLRPSTSTPQPGWRGDALAGWLTTKRGWAGTLTVSKENLTIESALGSFVFNPLTVATIQRAGFFPWLWSGIIVRHRVPGYPERIGFRPRGASSRHLLQILNTYGYQVAS